MNIAFFLIPKHEVICLNINSSMRQALEKMEFHSHTAVPLIDNKGKYAGTLTEGDLLWKIKNTPNWSFAETEHIKLKQLQLRVTNTPVQINAEIENLLSLAITQNFIPVIDDHHIFIGIIRRRDIIEHYVQPNNELSKTLAAITLANGTYPNDYY